MENRKNNYRRDGGKGFKKSDDFKNRNNKGYAGDRKYADKKDGKSFGKNTKRNDWSREERNMDTNWFDIEMGQSSSFEFSSNYDKKVKDQKKSGRSFDKKERSYDNDRPKHKASYRNNGNDNRWDSNDRFDRKARNNKKERYEGRGRNNRYNDYDDYDDITEDDMRYFERRGSGEGAKRHNYKSAVKALENKKKDDGTVRLNKYIANAGICSRREADVLIASGVVSVNGEVVTQMGYKVKPDDVVNYGGERLVSEKKRYVLLNKPKGYITTSDDPQERKTVMMLVENACKERIYPVGRLDRNTTGVLLFTNDGDMAKKLTHPSTGARKIYHVELDKNLTHADMQRMLEGLSLEDGEIAVDDVQYVGNGEHKNIVGVVLHSGRNRIVRRIFEAMGYEVCKLDRVVFAGLTKKDLPRGRWRLLTDKEVSFLKML